MEGRPAMMMKSLDWKPEVRRSRSSNPDASPVMCSFRSYSRSMCSKVSFRIERTGRADPCMRRSEIWKMSRSASSSSFSTSSAAAKLCPMISVAMRIRSRRRAFSRTMPP